LKPARKIGRFYLLDKTVKCVINELIAVGGGKMKLFVLLFSAAFAVAEQPQEITIVAGNGANVMPFGETAQGLYQQIYSRTLFSEIPAEYLLEVTSVSFTSVVLTGGTRVNGTMTLASARSISNDPGLNLGPDARVVFNGTNTAMLTGSSGDLRFDLKRGSPSAFTQTFVWDRDRGDLVLQYMPFQVSGIQGAFAFGPSGEMWRVYLPLGATNMVVESTGLNTIFTIKPVKKVK
jgi:hypothetical protein